MPYIYKIENKINAELDTTKAIIATGGSVIYGEEAMEHLKELIESRCNIARIPFLRETQAFVKLRGLFKFGKLFFSIRRTDDFMDYLNEKGL